jgi:hypothetical protein
MKFITIKLFVVSAIMLVATSAFASYSYNFDINTSGLNGQTGYIDLQMNSDNSSNVATATTSNFLSNATFLGAPSYIGNATGQLSDNSLFLSTAGAAQANDYFHQLTFGDYLHFKLDLAGAPNNTFALSFYAADGTTSLLSTNSLTGAAATIDLTADGAALQVTSAETTAAPTPIPAAAFLFGSGLMGLVGLRRRNNA